MIFRPYLVVIFIHLGNHFKGPVSAEILQKFQMPLLTPHYFNWSIGLWIPSDKNTNSRDCKFACFRFLTRQCFDRWQGVPHCESDLIDTRGGHQLSEDTNDIKARTPTSSKIGWWRTDTHTRCYFFCLYTIWTLNKIVKFRSLCSISWKEGLIHPQNNRRKQA